MTETQVKTKSLLGRPVCLGILNETGSSIDHESMLHSPKDKGPAQFSNNIYNKATPDHLLEAVSHPKSRIHAEADKPKIAKLDRLMADGKFKS